MARTLGDARYTNSGFALLSELPPGTHSLFVYAHTAGAGPQEGWNRASVASFETSLIEAAPTMVQPGPTPAGDSGRYQTGPASWQGGNTCVRYTGSGSCESSIPVGVATGASCIQWNQRGQCTNYVGGTDSAANSSPPPTPAVRSVPPSGPASVPTVTSGGAPRPPVGAPRAVAPPDAATGDDADGDATTPSSGPPHGALPAAAPPSVDTTGGDTTGGDATGGGDSPPAVRVAAPPPAGPAAASSGRTSPPGGAGTTAAAAPPGGATSRGSGAVSTPVVVLVPTAVGSVPTGPGDEAFPADAPPPVADSPLVQATAAALHPNNQTAGVAPLRSGCALYIGCGGDSATSAAASAATATRPPVLSSAASAVGATGGGAAVLSPNVVPTPTATPTACPPFGGCGGAR